MEPTGKQWCPRRAELRAQGTVLVRIRLWLPRPHSRSALTEEPPESSQAAAARPGKRHGELQFPCHVSLHRFWTPSAWSIQLLELDPRGD